jgi:hypothetical protein
MRFALSSSVTFTIALAVSTAALGCESHGPLEVNGVQTHTVSIAVGLEFGIRLSTHGPGEYVSPPTVSDSVIRFLDMTYVGPNNPGGPTQLFRFKAVSRGRSVITFQHSAGAYSVTDTVTVY